MKKTEVKKGKLIVIEGIDGVGKNTQAKLLQKYILDKGENCVLYSFPQYETKTGQLVKEYLTSGRSDLDLRGRAKLYADDRLAARDEIIDHLNKGTSVVCDRYTHSNIVYFEQFARMNEPESFGLIGEEIRTNEYVHNKLPAIDQMFTLSVSLEHYNSMMDSKGERSYTNEKLDRHEENLELIKGCHQLYGFYGKREGIFVQCDCEGELLSVEFISKVIAILYESFKSRDYAITGISVVPYKVEEGSASGIVGGYSARVVDEKMQVIKAEETTPEQMAALSKKYKEFIDSKNNVD